jgi:hypothetical protein
MKMNARAAPRFLNRTGKLFGIRFFKTGVGSLRIF